MYFLFIFGASVEDWLGKARFLFLILLATIAGDILHGLFFMDSQIPCIGASGGISGVLVFYTLKFPHNKLALMFRFFFVLRWIRFPAFVFLIFFAAQQAIILMVQFSGYGSVSALSHIGGGLVGFAFWGTYRDRKIIEAI
jgi:membrane associated rhomboid family serine protease